jgi:hypothetical protein
MQITETQIAGGRIKMRLAEITLDTQKEVAALELSVELSKLRLPDGSMVVPNPQRFPVGELQVAALRYICVCQRPRQIMPSSSNTPPASKRFELAGARARREETQLRQARG